MASVGIRDVKKAFGTTQVIHGVDISIADGEFVVLVGPSGCGKSTLLRMIAGLENITAGEIRIGDRVVNNVPPKERDIAMVFQNYALYPHMTVAANMGFSLKLRSAPKAEIDQRVDRAANILGLKPLLERYPRQLSGGQRQRVAMGRAIVRDPQVFLFDEPLSNLDAKLRVAMRTEIKELHQRLKTTTVYVTHDQIEAMTMADKIVVMHDGIVEQIGTPLDLYDKPDNLFVAGFIGSPAMNFLHGKVKANGAAGFEGPNGVKLPLATAPAASDGRPAVYGIRPEHFTIADDGAEAEIVVVEPTGSETQVFAKIGGHDVVRGVPRAPHVRARPPDQAQARSRAGAPVRRGDRRAAERVRERAQTSIVTGRSTNPLKVASSSAPSAASTARGSQASVAVTMSANATEPSAPRRRRGGANRCSASWSAVAEPASATDAMPETSAMKIAVAARCAFSLPLASRRRDRGERTRRGIGDQRRGFPGCERDIGRRAPPWRGAAPWPRPSRSRRRVTACRRRGTKRAPPRSRYRRSARFAPKPLLARGQGALLRACSISAATMRPCGPEPLIFARSIPASPARRRASGVTTVPPERRAGRSCARGSGLRGRAPSDRRSWSLNPLIPAKAGIQFFLVLALDARFRGGSGA